jgi:hypothetical protein
LQWLCTIDPLVNILNNYFIIVFQHLTGRWLVNSIWIVSATSALAACSGVPADRTTKAAEPTSVGASAASVTNNSTSEDNSVTASADQTPPRANPPRPAKPGDKILPSPFQPPAEVDPPHKDPGDRVVPVPPPSS